MVTIAPLATMVTVMTIAKIVKTMINWRYNGFIMQNANGVIKDDAYPLSPMDHDCRQQYGANRVIAIMLPMVTMMPMGTMVPMVTIVAMAMMVAMATIVPMINISAIGDHHWSPLTPLNGDITVRIAI